MTITKQQVETLIDGLADKCQCYCDDDSHLIHQPAGILVGHVLQRMGQREPILPATFDAQLVSKWRACTTEEERKQRKSALLDDLATIAGRIAWETCWCGELKCIHSKDCVKKRASIVVAKPSPESRLLEFIYSLNLC